MARNRAKDDLVAGLLGAGIGALGFKLNELNQQAIEMAEQRKQARLEQLAIAAETRAHDRALDLRSVDAAITEDRDKRTFAQQDKTLQSSQDHDVAVEGLRHEYRSQEGAAERGWRSGENAQDRATQLQVATTRNPQDDDSILGNDGNWYPKGTALPKGVKPAGGTGISWAPSESKATGATARPGAATRTAPYPEGTRLTQGGKSYIVKGGKPVPVE